MLEGKAGKMVSMFFSMKSIHERLFRCEHFMVVEQYGWWVNDSRNTIEINIFIRKNLIID